MARNVSPFKLGLFVLICGALGLMAIIWLGASHYFEEKHIYVSYFDESVKGLRKDAIVNYRGVAVGRVAAIGLGPDGRLIEVLMYLEPEFQVSTSIAIQLREQGLTGLRYLEIDTAPDNLAELTPRLTFEPPYPVIPSYPSEIEQLKTALESLYLKVSELDLKALTDKWTRTADLVNGVLVEAHTAFEPEEWRAMVTAVRRTAEESSEVMQRFSKAASKERVDKTFQDLSATLAATRQASEALAKQMKGLPPGSFTQMVTGWNDTLASGGTVFNNVDRQLNESAVLLQQSLQQLRVLLTQLNGLVQTVKEQPNRLIFSTEESDPFKRK